MKRIIIAIIALFVSLGTFNSCLLSKDSITVCAYFDYDLDDESFTTEPMFFTYKTADEVNDKEVREIFNNLNMYAYSGYYSATLHLKYCDFYGSILEEEKYDVEWDSDLQVYTITKEND